MNVSVMIGSHQMQIYQAMLLQFVGGELFKVFNIRISSRRWSFVAWMLATQHPQPPFNYIHQHKWKNRKSWFRWKITCVQIGVILLFGLLSSSLSFAISHNRECIWRMNDEVPRFCTSHVIGAPLRQPFSLDTAQEHKPQQRGSNTSESTHKLETWLVDGARLVMEHHHGNSKRKQIDGTFSLGFVSSAI